MRAALVRGVKRLANALGVEVRRIKPGRLAEYSNLEEETIIREYLSRIRITNRYCVDMAASDGVSMSNTYQLYRDGWSGLAVEYDAEKFSKLAYTYRHFKNVFLSKCKVTPLNVVELLLAHEAPKRFDFLSLDLDGYDYYILNKILGSFRPRLLCVEINEKIPPPLKFTARWDPHFNPSGGHFYGQSISQLHTLCVKYRYALVRLHYNNAFLIPRELSPEPSLSPDEAYKSGYRDQPDRKKKFPWNEDMEELLSLSPQDAVRFLNRYFSAYKGRYILKSK